jgi:peptidoglycan/xylan/chitin deacetylase (PgdA/CDA1 family)
LAPNSARVVSAPDDNDSIVDVGDPIVASGQQIDGFATPALTRRSSIEKWLSRLWQSISNRMPPIKSVWNQDKVQARILCYHRIADDPNPNLATYAIRPSDFRAQMQWLKDHGWHVISLTNMLAAFSEGITLRKTAVLTFDDGYQDLVDEAMPILAEFDYPATAFIVSDLVGKTAEWDVSHGGAMAPLATLDGLRALEGAGWEIGHHTRTHPRLIALDDEALANEIEGGKSEMERLLGHPVATFAYPFGINDQRVREATEAAGFRAGFALDTSFASCDSPKYRIERVCVLREHTLRDLQALLWFGRDVQGSLRRVIGGPNRIIQRWLERPRA